MNPFEKCREWLALHMNWQSFAIALVLVAVCAFFGGTLYQNWQSDHSGLALVNDTTLSNKTDIAQTPAAEKEVASEVKVHVVGAVSAAGVYTLPSDARVDDAVRAAGATASADLSQLNLAQKLTDGQKITVPTLGETPSTNENTATPTNDATASLININTATIDQLQDLPNIGEVRAKAIINYREEHGGFKSIEELKEVSGIGEKTFERLASSVTV